MQNKKIGYNQLMIVDNTKENHSIIKELNNKMKEFNSRWRIRKKYRLPKEGCKYGWGGSLQNENADGIGIYLYTTEKYNKAVWEERQKYYREKTIRENQEIEELKKENRLLKLQLNEYQKEEEINYLNNLHNGDYFDIDSYDEEILIRIKKRLTYNK